MARISPGRFTHDDAGDLVVFLIGMRVNKPWRPDIWLPTFLAMRPMIEELYDEPGSGFLSHRTLVSFTGPTVVQYWRSIEQLYAYASAANASHRPAWAAFNSQARRVPGVTGIWHETYVVSKAESIYVDMPVTGLAAATAHVRVTSRLDRARDRLARRPG